MSKTYGLIVDFITGNYQIPLFEALRKTAESAGINLLIFEGRALDAPSDVEYQHNIIYKLLNDAPVDGFIVSSSTVFNYYPADRGCLLLLKNITKPVVSLNVAIPGFPSVMIDNHSGMVEVVEHLINVHDYKNLAFVTGPSGNAEANKRLAAYMQVLKKHDIRINADWIIPGNFRPEDGVKAIKILKDQPDIDAIVFANDDMALGAQEYLDNHYPELADSIPITGFDNLPSTDLLTRPLTSVTQPFNDIAIHAFDLLEKYTRGDTEDTLRECKTYLDVKRSCGCETEFHIRHNPDTIIQYTSTVHESFQSFDKATLYEQLDEALARYNIDTCFIALYPEPIGFDFGETAISETLALDYAYRDGDRISLENPISFPSSRIIPESFYNDVFSTESQATLVIKPLFFGDKHFGYALFDAKSNQYINIEPLRGFLSCCLAAALG